MRTLVDRSMPTGLTLKRMLKPMAVQKKSASLTQRQFASEAALVESFVEKLGRGRTRYGRVEVATEWDHRSGVVDVLARNAHGALFAFEAKLENWRRAFDQAYRNTAYANRAYVLLPPAAAQRALQDKQQFQLRGIGLCSFDGRAIRVLIEAADQEALLTWVRARAHQHFDTITNERDAHARLAAGFSTSVGLPTRSRSSKTLPSPSGHWRRATASGRSSTK